MYSIDASSLPFTKALAHTSLKLCVSKPISSCVLNNSILGNNNSLSCSINSSLQSYASSVSSSISHLWQSKLGDLIAKAIPDVLKSCNIVLKRIKFLKYDFENTKIATKYTKEFSSKLRVDLGYNTYTY